MYITEYWLKSVIYIIFLVNQEPNKLTLSNLWTWKWFLNKLKHQHQKNPLFIIIYNFYCTMFIYTISNDIYHDKVLKPSVVTIRRLSNDKEAIHNNIRILIVYRTETRIFVTSLKWSSSPARVLTRCWIIGHTCLELVYVKNFSLMKGS